MFYAERLGNQDIGEPYIAEKGIFLSIEEFVPYRLKGWTASKKNNQLVDEYIKANQLQPTTD